MCACWSLDPRGRPSFSDICETLIIFNDDASNYKRLQTQGIEDDYYLQPTNPDDRPVYEEEIESERYLPSLIFARRDCNCIPLKKPPTNLS